MYTVSKNVIHFRLSRQHELKMSISPARALFEAVHDGNFKLADQLLRGGAKVNVKFEAQTCLHVACFHGYLEIFNLLMLYEADIFDRDGLTLKTPLHLAIFNGHTEIVKLLIHGNADINTKVPHPPLYEAIQRGHHGIVELLLLNGADVNVEVDGSSLLSMAIQSEHTETMKCLARFLAKVNDTGYYVSDKNKESLRHDAVRGYYNECVKELASMKNEQILEEVTVYGMLTLGIDYSTVRSPKVVQLMESRSYYDSFPKYASMLTYLFEEAKEMADSHEIFLAELEEELGGYNCWNSSEEAIYASLAESYSEN